MQTLTALKTAHDIATLVLLATVGIVIWRAWKSWRAGDKKIFGSTLQRPWAYAWMLMGVSLLSFPFTGWWMVHTVGWSLGQTWLLAGASLYIVGACLWLWLLARVNRLRLASGADEASIAKQRKLVFGIAAVGLAVLLVLLVLMLAKPA